MRCRYLVPTLGLLTCVGSASAVDVGGLTIGGFVDSILTFEDQDITDDPTIDFWSGAVLQFGATIGDSVSLQIDTQYDGDTTDVDLRQAYSVWAINEQVSLQFGKSISWIGWQAAYAPGLYRINVTPYVGDYYGNDTVGVWGIITPTEMVSITLAVVDDIYGSKTESDSLAFGGEVSIDVEGYGNVQLELMFDQSGADYFDSSAEPDEAATAVVLHTTADQLVENLTLGAEFATADYDSAASMAFMAMANYAFGTDIPMSATIMASYWDPNDDADDDEVLEIALALLTNPTDDANFALNAEFRYVSVEEDDLDLTGFYLEALAIIP